MPERARPCSNNGSLMLHYHYLRYKLHSLVLPWNLTFLFHGNQTKASLHCCRAQCLSPDPLTIPKHWLRFSPWGAQKSLTHFCPQHQAEATAWNWCTLGGKRICSSLSCPPHITIPACWCWGLPGSHKHFTLLPKLTLYKYSKYDLTLFPFKGKKIACLQNTSVYMFLYQSKIWKRSLVQLLKMLWSYFTRSGW